MLLSSLLPSNYYIPWIFFNTNIAYWPCVVVILYHLDLYPKKSSKFSSKSDMHKVSVYKLPSQFLNLDRVWNYIWQISPYTYLSLVQQLSSSVISFVNLPYLVNDMSLFHLLFRFSLAVCVVRLNPVYPNIVLKYIFARYRPSFILFPQPLYEHPFF